MMSREELLRYETIRRANDGLLTVAEAAQALGISERQAQRLKKRVQEEGAQGVKHRNAGKASVKRTAGETVQQIITLKESEVYKDCNLSHFRELLSTRHGIEISYSALLRMLAEHGIRSPMTRRRFKPHRRRKRKAQAGLLVQVDATPYQWFKGDKKYYALHGAIDDATGQITALYMCKNECLHGYYEMLRRTIENYGVPVSLYADRHTIFQSPNKSKAEIDSSVKVNDTQFGRSLKELGVELIGARSPQAKGRIERLWQTLQSRLPVEFAIEDITTLDCANQYLGKYIYAYNSEFALEPEDSQSMFHKLPAGQNLDHILCIKEERLLDSGGVMSYGGKKFKAVETNETGFIPKNAKVYALVCARFGVKIQYRRIVFDAIPYAAPKRANTKSQSAEHTMKPPRSVPDEHYYKYGQRLFPRLVYDESDREIQGMLEDIFLRGMSAAAEPAEAAATSQSPRRKPPNNPTQP